MALSISRSQYIIATGCLIVITGFSVIAGWQFDIPALKGLVPGVKPMNPVVAVTFIVSGVWLLFSAKGKYLKLQPVLCFIVTAVGVIHFSSYLAPGEGVRMDYLLYGDKIKSSNIPKLIAPNTALAFIFCGISMFSVSTKQKWMLVLRQVLIVTGFALVYISILGYIYNIQPIYRVGGYSPMALYTAILFLFLNFGLFLTNAEYGISRTFTSSLNGGRLLRKVFIFMLLLPPLTGYLRLMGEHKGLYPTEFGVELHTIILTLVVFIFVTLYASLENKKQLASIRAERQLAMNEQRYRAFFNSLKEGVASIDYQGKIMYCNPAYCKMLGYSEAELVGQVVVNMIIPLGKRQEFYDRLEARKDGREEDYETEVIKKTGDKIWITIKSRTLYDEDGSAYAYIVSVNDVTEERLKIEDLKAFTGSAAHDLNAPLSRIAAVIDLFEKDNLDEEQKMYLSMIEETSGAMRQLLQDLLSFSRLGATQLEKRELDIDHIVQDICTAHTPADFKGEVIKAALPPAKGNEGAIRQLFNNLISNAIKYSSKKDRPRIEIGTYEKNGETVYYVKDNGVGLNAEQIRTLFTPFKRFHTDFEGNGLGLAIVKRVIEKHSGNIWAESEPGKGLAFNFTLSPDMT